MSIVAAQWQRSTIDPLFGLPIAGKRQHGGYDVEGIQQLAPKAIGVFLGPASGGLLAIDLDGPRSEAKFQQMNGRPSSHLPKALAWSSGKTKRCQEDFFVDHD